MAVGAAAAALAFFVGYVCGDRTGAVLVGAAASAFVQTMLGTLRMTAR